MSSSGTCKRSVANLLCFMHDFQKEWKYTDVTIVVGDQRFQAHLVVLCAVSPVFNKIFSTEMREGKSRVLEIEDVDSSTFEVFLDYCYSGEIHKVKDAGQLLMLCDKYDVELTPEFITRMVQMLDVGNVFDYLVAADLYKQVDLENKSFAFLLQNSKKVLDRSEWRLDYSKLGTIIDIFSRVNKPVRSLLDGEVNDKVEWTVSDYSLPLEHIYEAKRLIPYHYTMISLHITLSSTNVQYTSARLLTRITDEVSGYQNVSLQFTIELIDVGKPPREFTICERITKQDAVIATFTGNPDISKWLSSKGIVRITVCQTTHTSRLPQLGPLKSECCSDVSIVVQGRTFYTHKVVLTTHSKYFASLLKDNLSEYKLEKVCPKSFAILKDFMYSNELPEKNCVDADVLEGACILQLTEMVIQHCQYIVCSKMNIENCTRCLTIALKWDLKLLKEYSIKFIADQLQGVLKCESWKFFVGNHPEILPDLFREKLLSFK